MKLDRLILVNWGQLRPGNYDMGNMTLLTGETGSGKSTMLDGLQTIMTGANKNLMNYNPGQDEVTKGQRGGKTKRTLESYIVGAEYNNFSRQQGAQGFMAAVFRPGQGEKSTAFTALVAASARVEGAGESRQARPENLSLIIIDDAALTFEDFVKGEDSNEYVSVEHIARHLKLKYSVVTDFNEKKGDYLCALYGRFRGKKSITKDEAERAARAWVESIAYRPIGSVHELVRDEILDFDTKKAQEDIDRISGLMRQVSFLREESARLKTNVSKLETLHKATITANAAHVAHVQQAVFVAKLKMQNNDEQILKNHKEINEAKLEEEKEASNIVEWKNCQTSLEKQRSLLNARLQGIPAHTHKIDLEDKRDKAQKVVKDTLAHLAQALTAAALLDQAAKNITEVAIPAHCKHLQIAAEKVRLIRSRIDFSQISFCRDTLEEVAAKNEFKAEQLHSLGKAFNGVNQYFEDLYEALMLQENNVLWATISDEGGVTQQKQNADDRLRDLTSRRARLAKGKAPYPEKVDIALRILQETFPSANAQVLCDLIEPASEKWQSVIESYMGGARFNLIVQPEWERKSVEYLKEHNVAVKVIQGSMCLENTKEKRLPIDSLVHELKSANPVALAYLMDQYGGVLKVNNTEDLLRVGRGVTLSGVGSGGRAMYALKDVPNVFGQKSRQIALEKTLSDLAVAEKDAQYWAGEQKFLESIKTSLQPVRQPRFNAAPLTEAGLEIEKSRQALATLDLSETEEQVAALTKVEIDLEKYKEWIEDSLINQGAKGEAIKNSQASLSNLELARQELLENVERSIKKMHSVAEVDFSLNYSDLLEQVDKKIQAGEKRLTKALTELEDLSLRPESLLIDVRSQLSEYNLAAKHEERIIKAIQQSQENMSFAANYPALVELAQDVAKTLEGLRGVGFYNNRQELSQAESSFHDVFTKQFCVEIKSRVDEGVRTLRQMNAELRNLTFGSDSFTIDWSRWEPEFHEYYNFFEAVTRLADSAEQIDLFSEEKLSGKHIEIRDKLVKLLLNEDHDRALNELSRIADYRNYRRYDIINKTESGASVRLSEWGTGSGGQLETPAYIVRAAIVTNRLKIFEKGASLKLLVNDESFAKMDERRARAVLGFLRDKLDLQVISAMPTMKAGALKDEFNREYSFSRLTGVVNGELDFISECDERDLNIDQMRGLWERQRDIAKERAKQLFDLENPEENAPA